MKKETDVRKYLREIGIARDKGGALNKKQTRIGGTIKGSAIKMATMINKTMETRKSEVITIQRIRLPELFGNDILYPAKTGRRPTIKREVRKILMARGIQVHYSRTTGLMDFIKVEATKSKSF